MAWQFLLWFCLVKRRQETRRSTVPKRRAERQKVQIYSGTFSKGQSAQRKSNTSWLGWNVLPIPRFHSVYRHLSQSITRIVALAVEEGQMAKCIAKEDRYRSEALNPELEKWLTWLAQNWKTHFVEDRSSPSASSSPSWDYSWWPGYSKWTWKNDDWMEDTWWSNKHHQKDDSNKHMRRGIFIWNRLTFQLVSRQDSGDCRVYTALSHAHYFSLQVICLLEIVCVDRDCV